MFKFQQIFIIFLVLCFLTSFSCVSPQAIQTNVLDQLKELQVAEELSIWNKKLEAQTINTGAGWVVIGTSVIALIFMWTGLLIVRAFLRRGRSLTMLTGVVQGASPETIADIKRQLRSSKRQDREDLRSFCKKVGTLVKS